MLPTQIYWIVVYVENFQAENSLEGSEPLGIFQTLLAIFKLRKICDQCWWSIKLYSYIRIKTLCGVLIHGSSNILCFSFSFDQASVFFSLSGILISSTDFKDSKPNVPVMIEPYKPIQHTGCSLDVRYEW